MLGFRSSKGWGTDAMLGVPEFQGIRNTVDAMLGVPEFQGRGNTVQ
jgi:hypothetical protein